MNSTPEQSRDSQGLPPDRSHVDTERRDDRHRDLHTLSVEALVERLNEADRTVPEALAAAGPMLSSLISSIEPKFKAGGRVVYLGAGTSGRLGVLDASEIPPTFQMPDGRFVGIIAGGDRSLRKSSESREDELLGAVDQLEPLALNSSDTLIGIAAGGSTPYVLGALEWSKSLSTPPLTALISCASVEPRPWIDHTVVLDTGPEVLTGSTRMKAGTATKLALNTISTTLMIRSGRVHENLMVDMRATNEKLRDRAVRILCELTGLPRGEAFSVLQSADGDLKLAVVMHSLNASRDEAAARLERVDRDLSRALED